MAEVSLAWNPLCISRSFPLLLLPHFSSSSLFSSFVSFPNSGIHQAPKSMINLYQPVLEACRVWRVSTTRVTHCCTLMPNSLEPARPAHLSLEPGHTGVNHSDLWPAELGLTYTHIPLKPAFQISEIMHLQAPKCCSVKHRPENLQGIEEFPVLH